MDLYNLISVKIKMTNKWEFQLCKATNQSYTNFLEDTEETSGIYPCH